MSRDEPLRDAVRAFLKQAVETSGMTPAALARRAGVSPSTISRPLNDASFNFTPRPSTLRAIAEAAGLDYDAWAPIELQGAGKPPPQDGFRRVPVVGVVQAGAWAEIPEEVHPEEFIPIQLPEYGRANLFALRISGRSMDRFYPDGSYVVVAPAHEAGVRDGDHVVVRRKRGSLAETTLKEVVQERDGSISLYPRSTDPAFKEPLRVERVREADEGPEVIGVVVASYAVRGNRSGPLVM